MRRPILLLIALVLAVPASGGPADARDSVRPDMPYLDFDTTEVFADRRAPLDLQSQFPSDDPTHTLELQVLRTSIRTTEPPAWQVTRTLTYDDDLHHLRVPVRQGQVLCARAREVVGSESSAWTARTCVARMIDDRRLRTTGDVRIVDDPAWPDGRATVLGPGARVILPRVPRGAIVGPLANRPRRVPGCLVGGRRSEGNLSYYPDAGRIFFRRHRAAVTGRLVCSSHTAPKRIGGAGFLPRWAQAPRVRHGSVDRPAAPPR